MWIRIGRLVQVIEKLRVVQKDRQTKGLKRVEQRRTIGKCQHMRNLKGAIDTQIDRQIDKKTQREREKVGRTETYNRTMSADENKDIRRKKDRESE